MIYVESITVKVDDYDKTFSISKYGYLGKNDKDTPLNVSIKASSFLGALLAGGIEKAEKFFPGVKISQINLSDHTTHSYIFFISNEGVITCNMEQYRKYDSFLKYAQYVGALLASGEQAMQACE